VRTKPQPNKAILLLGWIGGLLILIWLGQQMRRGDTPPFDDRIRLLVHAHAIPAVTALMRGLSLIGRPEILIAAGALVIFWLARTGRARTAVLFGIVVAGAEIVDQLLKLVFHRMRPVPFFGLAEPRGYSFPSGHALVSCAFFGMLAALAAARTPSRARRCFYYAAAAAMTAAIGFSRVYLGVHYPSDVLGGWAAAVSWLFSVAWVRLLLPLPKRIRPARCI
jgi:undecaprenyl-diphosphatase